MNNEKSELRPWKTLDPEEQTDLRVVFGHFLDTLPPTCSLERKVERFRSWLQNHGVDYQDAS